MRLFMLSLIIIALGLSSLSHAQQDVLFKEDFNQELVGKKYDTFFFLDVRSPSTTTSMPYGKGDLYERSSTVAYQAGYSLRLNFNGKNNYLNTCGVKETVRASALSNDKTYLITEPVKDMTEYASQKRWVYNKTSKFERWDMASISEGKLMFLNNKPSLNEMMGREVFKTNDELQIMNVCGLDGTIGNNIRRRNDGDRLFVYLQYARTEAATASVFPVGSTLARRMYFYVDSNAVLPAVNQKLAVMYWRRSDGTRPQGVLSLRAHRGLGLTVVGSVPGKSSIESKVLITRNKWFYVEEVFTRETTLGGADGKYELYVGEAGSEPVLPSVTWTGIHYGAFNAISFGGNIQHFNDVSGFFYFDNIVISKKKIGPAI